MKVIMDFEEELGSPHLPDAVKEYIDDLSSDMLVIFDGPRHLKNEPTLTFGARGISDITLKVYGPYFPQHSGHYGNYVPNPAVRLSKLISSMKDDFGRVTIPGFYDGISISDDVREILNAVPDDEDNIRLKMGIAAPDSVAPSYQESLQYPSLNVRGMLSAWVGDEARTIIPSLATAEIDMRLVLESDPDRLIGLVRDHIESEGYYVIDRKPTAQERLTNDRICEFQASTSYLAYRTDFDSDIGIWLDRALTKAFSSPPIKQRTSGGSIPISPFVNQLGIPAVTVPTVNRDNNQHSPNENIRIGNYIDGIKTVYSILTEPLD
jgi:acetylornithine deacetylase/succinyl-diaminopimelate desuccinylase-like protein